MIAQMGKQGMDDKNFLRNVTLFAEFSPEELSALRRSMIVSRYGPGDTILEEGNANRALHILKSGRIRVSRRVEEREVPLCDLVEGQTFGELSIIEDGVASASLRAVADSEILSIPIQGLATFLSNHPNAPPNFCPPIPLHLPRRPLHPN